jgi:hypothetical protein
MKESANQHFSKVLMAVGSRNAGLLEKEREIII